MACDLISNMEAIGFRIIPQGGNCRAMVKHVNGRTIVATGGDGDLPGEDDFLVCVYEGQWDGDPDGARELDSFTPQRVGDTPASGLSPIDEALRLALAGAGADPAAVTASDRVLAYLNGHGERPSAEDVAALIEENKRAPRPCPDWHRELSGIAAAPDADLREACGGFRCSGCGREGADCSADPCEDVIADREGH